MPRLIQLSGSTARRQFALRAPLTKIGRAETNEIDVDNQQSSRFPAKGRFAPAQAPYQQACSRSLKNSYSAKMRIT